MSKTKDMAIKQREPDKLAENMITFWMRPDEPASVLIGERGKSRRVRSSYGDITNSEWCQREIKRIGPTAQLIKSASGKIAIARDCAK